MSRIQILLKKDFSNWSSFRVIKKYKKTTAVQISAVFWTFKHAECPLLFWHGLFWHLSNHPFCSLKFLKYISYEAHFDIQNVEKLIYLSEMQKTIEKIISVLQMISFELIPLNTHFCWQRILVIGSQYIKKRSQDIRYYTKTEFFELKFFQSDQKISQNNCGGYLSSVSDLLTCWLSISVPTRGFLGI